jgi:hypothetical protein
MSQASMDVGIAGHHDLGLVGSRQLHAVQLFDIGRLTSHPVALIPGTFVAVSGRGPGGGSNESGKTTFLAAVSLLLGDAEWRLTGNGHVHAAELLFNPQAVGAEDQSVDAAMHGYVVGLFAHPARSIGSEAREPLTVWLRINRASPYLEVRVQQGVGLIEADTHAACQLEADLRWASLPRVAGRRVGSRNLAEVLYGSARCIAQLPNRGGLPSEPSLLNTNAGSFSPEKIGTSLIGLAGIQDILDDGRVRHGNLTDAEQRLRVRRAEAAERERSYADRLRELDGRDRARERLAVAERDWETHDARRLLDAIEARDDAQRTLDDAARARPGLEQTFADAERQLRHLDDGALLAEQLRAAQNSAGEAKQAAVAALITYTRAADAVENLRGRLRELRLVADDWDGPDMADTERTLTEAQTALAAAERQLAIREAETQRAHGALARAREGSGDATDPLDALRGAGVPAAGLLDGVELDEQGRREIEPLLWPFRDAVVVARDDQPRALVALAQRPCAVLISGPAEHLPPAGVTSCPAGARRFLSQLAASARADADPERVAHEALDVTVIGGLLDPLTGRDARIAAAQRAADAAQAQQDETEHLRDEAKAVVVDRTDDHRRAQAAAELTAVTTKLADSEQRLDALAQTQDDAAAAHDGAEDAARELDVQLRGLKAARASAQEDRDDATADLVAHDTQVSETQAALGVAGRDVVSASQNWPNGEEAARERCAEDPRDEGRLRNVANETLHESLVAVGLPHGAEDEAPSDELIAALRRRRADENTPFPVVAGPLRAYLDERSDHDIVLRERIEAERAQTREALDEADSECSEMRASLDRIQEAIQRQVEGTINGISEQFNELDREGGGYGACLRLDMQPPVDASDTWRWSVTPMWKRAPRGPMVAYNAPTNSAQDKIYTVNLVLAALLGVGNSEGKVLILDELGNSLDFEHRRSVLSAIAQTAQRRGITVLGTCQDDIVGHAADFADEIVFFEYSSDRDILNRPVRLFGFDSERERVERSYNALLRGRPVV